jgi:hypothetical protein
VASPVRGYFSVTCLNVALAQRPGGIRRFVAPGYEPFPGEVTPSSRAPHATIAQVIAVARWLRMR